MLKDFDQLFLMKFITDNLILFFLYCVCWRFFGRNSNNFEFFLRKVWLISLPEGSVILRDAKSVSNLCSGFLSSRSGLLYRMDKKSEFFTFFRIKSIKQFLLELGVVTIEPVFQCNCIHCLQCNSKVYFSGIVLYVQQMQSWSHSL